MKRLTILSLSAAALIGCTGTSNSVVDDFTHQIGFRSDHGELSSVIGDLDNYSAPAGFRAKYFPSYGDEIGFDVTYVGSCRTPLQLEINVDGVVTEYESGNYGTIDCMSDVYTVEKTFFIPIEKVKEIVSSQGNVLIRQTFAHSTSTYSISESGIDALEQTLTYLGY